MKKVGKILGIIVVSILGIIGWSYIFSSCFSCGCSCGSDGICDHAGCKKKAMTTFGGEMEFCLEHYSEWSKRASND